MPSPTIPPIADIDLRLLRVFKTVVECGGFAAATETLGIGRSTISTHIADLEARLGLRLCERGRAGFILSDQGQIVYEAATNVFGALDSFRGRVGSAKGKLVGELRIWTMDNLVSDPRNPIVEAIKSFQRRASQVNLIMNVAACDEVGRAVYDGKASLGLTIWREGLNDIDYEQLYVEETALYCAREHPLFAIDDATIDPDMLAEHNYVLRGYVGSDDRFLSRRCRSTAMATDIESTLNFVLTGLYIGYLPTFFAQRWEIEGRIRQLARDRMKVESPVYLVTRKADRSDHLVAAFVEDVRGAMTGVALPGER